MAARIPIEVFPPGETIKEELEARGWTQADLADILGRPPRLVSEIIAGKRSITPETARGLGAAFGTSAQFWMNLASSYQLSKVTAHDDESVARRAQLFSVIPQLNEVFRRGWIEETGNVSVLEERVKSFLGIATLTPEAVLQSQQGAAARASSGPSPVQAAWLARARQLARGCKPEGEFTPEKIPGLITELNVLKKDSDGLGQIPGALTRAGIRFVIVEPLATSKIDGFCFWLTDTAPVIAMTLRFDRIDAFWFTLFHELGHINAGDGKSGNPLNLDENILESSKDTDRTGVERDADDFASEALIPEKRMRQFMATSNRYITKENIMYFAKQIGAHPGIIVGRLHHLNKQYTHFRDLLVKVREQIIPHATTDGWGRSGVSFSET